MRVVFLLVATFVAFAPLSEANDSDPLESDSKSTGWLVLLVICLLACLSLALCTFLAYFFIFKSGGLQKKESTEESRKPDDDVESSDVESTAVVRSPTIKKPKEMDAKLHSFGAFNGHGGGSTLPVCPNCPLRSSEKIILHEKMEQKPPSYDETMRTRARNQQSSVSTSSLSAPFSDVKHDQREVKRDDTSSKMTTSCTQQTEPTKHLPPRRSHSASALTARRFSLSTDDSSELDDHLVVNQMRSEDMIRPSKPIYHSCVRPPPVSAEAINEIAGAGKSSSESNVVASVVQPKMIHIGYPTAPKYIAPGSSESVSLLSQRSENDSNIMYSQEHLIDFSKKDETKATGAPPLTLSQSRSSVASSLGSTQVTNTSTSYTAPTQLSSNNSCTGQPANAPSDVSTKTAVEEMSLSERDNSVKAGNENKKKD